jgi:4-amino-4-deoxy-L-arabinose transferase-like glycosyltransferase
MTTIHNPPKIKLPIQKLKLLAFWLFVITVIITPRLLDLDVFYARDELAIWHWADQFALAVWANDWAGTLTTSDYPGIPMFWTQTLFLTFKYSLPALFEKTMIPLEQLFDFRSLPLLAERRMAGGLLVGGQLIATVWLTSRLFGRRRALLAATFLGLDPFGLTEARVFRLEMVSAGFVTLSVLAYLLYWQNKTRRWVLVSGLMAGLAVSSKTSGGLMVPFIWLLLLLELFRGGLFPNRFKAVILTGLLWAGGAVTTFWLIWPAIWVEPLAALQYLWQTGFAQAADRSVWGDEIFFWGQVVKGGDPGPWFYPVALVFRTTPLTWLGLAAVGVWLRRQIIRHNSLPERSIFAPTGQLLLFAGLILLELTFIISKVDRFLIVIFPVLSILTAIGVNLLIEKITLYARKFPGIEIYVPAGLIIIVLMVQLAQTIPAHPYYYTYWNPLAGGGQTAMKVLPIGAGEGVDLAMDYLNRLPNAANLSVVCGGSQPWCQRTFKGTTYRSATYASGEWFLADYASFYISALQRQKYPPEIVDFFQARRPDYQVELGGVNYMQVYKIPQTAHFAGAWNDLAGQARLLGYDLGASPQQVGAEVNAAIWWVNRGAGVDNLTVRLIDQTGYEWSRTQVTPHPDAQRANIPAERQVVVGGEARLTIPPGMPPGLYFWRIGVTTGDKNLIVGDFILSDETDQLVIEPGQIFTNANQFDIDTRLDQPLAPNFTLLGYNPPAGPLNPLEPTWLELVWQAGKNPPDYQVRLRLVNPETGAEAARWQGRPGHNAHPTHHWQPGEINRDVWALKTPPVVTPGRYSLKVSLYPADAPAQAARQTAVIPNIEVWTQPLTVVAPDMQNLLDATFGNHLALPGYDLYYDTDGAGAGALSPVFYWQSQVDFEGTVELQLTLRAADSGQILQAWQLPLPGELPKTLWQANEVVITPYRLNLAAPPGGAVHLDVALTDSAGRPLPVEVSGKQTAPHLRLENIQNKIVVRVAEN